MGRKYRVVLEVQSNFVGEPDEAVEAKTVKDFIEGMRGVGEISVKDIVELLPGEERKSRTSFGPEKPTRKRRRV
jgi:hypothetical protein